MGAEGCVYRDGVVNPGAHHSGYVEASGYFTIEELEEFLWAAYTLPGQLLTHEVIEPEQFLPLIGPVFSDTEIGGRKIRLIPSTEPPSSSSTFEACCESGELKLTPKVAFGTGHHPTTRMIMETLAELDGSQQAGEPYRGADIGTGSGVLALYLALEKKAEVIAVDNVWPVCCEALDNIRKNCCEKHIQVVCGGLEALLQRVTSESSDMQRLDVVCANLYQSSLLTLEPIAYHLLKSSGSLLLSGITADQSSDVVEAFQGTEHWELLETKADDTWRCLHFRRL